MHHVISIGNDHAGTAYKHAIVAHLQSRGYTVLNRGTDHDSSVDYPDYGHAVAEDVSQGKAQWGIVLCGSGNGINMTVNKHADIRAALCWNREIVTLARQHNNANVLSIPARFTALPQVLDMVDAFLDTAFEGGRHAQRVAKIRCA